MLTEENKVNTTVSICGTVEKITYQNRETGFSVIKLKTEKDLITTVGIFPFLGLGEEVEVYGNYIVHPNFGNQFKATRFNRILPSDAAAILKYLSSGSVKGIGPATARNIVERFGNQSLEIIENDYMRLTEIRGISEEKAEAVHAEFLKQIGLKSVMLALSKFDITPEECMNIYKKFGVNSMEIIAQNPYVLCCEDIGFSFERVETIAESYGIEPNSTDRLSAGIEYVLRYNMFSGGHTCLPEEKLLSVATTLLSCDTEEITNAYLELCDSFNLFREEIDGRFFAFLPEYYSAERYIAARLCATLENIPKTDKVSELEIDYTENTLGVKFEKLQREAIKTAVEKGALVLTGGPGTGKTTILNAVISILERRNIRIMTAAPTGRAAKRMTQVTGYEAKTLHRMLECAFIPNEKSVFLKNEGNLLECDAIIVDEMSMVDTLLFESLLRALPLTTRIILVGDADQLPSVAAGNILQDILDSDILPSVRLTRIFRQAKSSKIVVNAHAIINGETVDFSREENSDCFFIRELTAEHTTDTVLSLICDRLPKAYSFSSVNDIQVLCPSRKLNCGSINLNNILQNAVNPKTLGDAELYSKGFYYRVGDKVMQTKNDYDIAVTDGNGNVFDGVFNGDIGFVESINTIAHTMKIRFDNGVAEYPEDKLSELELAYAITVHKSQGSEFDCVILPLFDTPSQLRYRNLLYTSMTRAKKLLVVVGKPEIFVQMAENDRKTKRYTALANFIEETVNA